LKLASLKRGRTLVLGFGREGRALERAMLAGVPEARVEVICEQAPDLPPRAWPLRIGSLDRVLPSADRILRSPGVPVRRAGVAAARRRGVPVTCISSLWFGERPDARVIAVTGSKGKSTTASLIHHLLSTAGLEVELAGNIGLPVLERLDARPDWFVLELSSYQLADLEGRVDVGVITRLFPEHQDWHGGVEPYYAAKLRMFELAAGREVWINAGDPVLCDRTRAFPGVQAVNRPGGIVACADGVWRDGRCVLPRAEAPLAGRHNLDNIALALAVAESVGVEFERLPAGLKSFRPLPHRLQRIPDRFGRVWINDAISTTPHATLAALTAFEPNPPGMVLIVGGQERDADWRAVAACCRQRPLRGLIGLPDNGARIVGELKAAGAAPVERAVVVDTLEQAVGLADRWSAAGDCVLLSPGAPSFPRFRDFEQRGGRFVELVNDLGRSRC